jgi:protocatechuate 3,4-dioxygenase, beta subunit
MEKTRFNRRSALSRALTSAGILTLASTSKISSAASDFCQLSPEQPEGPFYPIEDRFDKNNDLTKVAGKIKSATGEVVLLKGIVRDDLCRPISGALVEIWQACASGKYDHPQDPNPAPKDEFFQFWGRSTTNEKGEYLFKTIIPGAYPASSTWVRPPHIHMKVHLRGLEELTTQVYFSEAQDLNLKDRILQGLTNEEQKNVTIEFKKENRQDKWRSGNFNISLKRL